MADEGSVEDYPSEIEEYLTGFESSLNSVQNVIQTLMSVSKGDQLKLDPLEQAKLDLMSAYTINSMFWMYLVTQGVNPKEHGIKQELERIRTYMNRVKEMMDKKKAARLDKGAASRFVRNALWDAEEATTKGGPQRPGKAESGSERPGKDKGGPQRPGKAESGSERPGKDKGGPQRPGKAESGSERPSKDKGGPQRPGKAESSSKRPSKDKGGPLRPSKAKQRKRS
ncbi:nuclear nucleic acid-binding protein C1D [Brachyhypopomus gauderio]|uniref:nuclear nucleic acid-binding protein C1D n=1 Tax=Brachyhypopomus gauderio TaxID=698409 RepID=UPI004041FE12